MVSATENIHHLLQHPAPAVCCMYATAQQQLPCSRLVPELERPHLLLQLHRLLHFLALLRLHQRRVLGAGQKLLEAGLLRQSQVGGAWWADEARIFGTGEQSGGGGITAVKRRPLVHPGAPSSACRALTRPLPWSVPNAFPMSPPPNMAGCAEDEGPGLQSGCAPG